MFRVSKAVGAFLISESDHMGMAYVENVWSEATHPEIRFQSFKAVRAFSIFIGMAYVEKVWSETTHPEIRFQRKAFNTKPDWEKKGAH